MIAVIALTMALVAALSILAYRLATFALPVMLAVAAARFAHGSGAGWAGAGIVGVISGAASFGILTFLFASVRTPFVRLAVAVIFAAPMTEQDGSHTQRRVLGASPGGPGSARRKGQLPEPLRVSAFGCDPGRQGRRRTSPPDEALPCSGTPRGAGPRRWRRRGTGIRSLSPAGPLPSERREEARFAVRLEQAMQLRPARERCYSSECHLEPGSAGHRRHSGRKPLVLVVPLEGNYEKFTSLLLSRGVYPTAYRDGTLREKLFGEGPLLPANHPAALYRDIEAVKTAEAARRRENIPAA